MHNSRTCAGLLRLSSGLGSRSRCLASVAVGCVPGGRYLEDEGVMRRGLCGRDHGRGSPRRAPSLRVSFLFYVGILTCGRDHRCASSKIGRLRGYGDLLVF